MLIYCNTGCGTQYMPRVKPEERMAKVPAAEGDPLLQPARGKDRS